MTKQKDNTLLKQALEYHWLGWCVIPIPRGSKKAQIRWKKYQQARPDESQLRTWFNGNPSNIAVILGGVSGGLACRDFDSMVAYNEWRENHKTLAERLPTVQTKRGRHVYFKASNCRNMTFNDGELRARDVYCLLPPSLHPDGNEYIWLIYPNGQIPELNPFTCGLAEFTEETEETDETEEADERERHGSNVGGFECFLQKFDVEAQKLINNAIINTLPKKDAQRNHMLFQLCRWLKGIEELAGRPVKGIKPILREWHRRALPVIGTKPFDETWADFTYGWPRVKWPKGDNILKQAIEKAIKAKNILPEAQGYDSAETQLLVRVCFELQKMTDKEPFWLSCRNAGNILGISHTEANKRLKMLVADEVLQEVQKNTNLRATWYRYIAD